MGIVLHPIEADGPVLPSGVAVPSALNDVIASTRELYSRKGYESPWVCYLAFEHDACVGTCGFTGPPADGEIEIAYFTFPGNEGRGVATRMATALLEIARAQAIADLDVVANTLPEAGPSCSILMKLGFRCLGEREHREDGTIWKWTLD